MTYLKEDMGKIRATSQIFSAERILSRFYKEHSEDLTQYDFSRNSRAAKSIYVLAKDFNEIYHRQYGISVTTGFDEEYPYIVIRKQNSGLNIFIDRIDCIYQNKKVTTSNNEWEDFISEFYDFLLTDLGDIVFYYSEIFLDELM